MVRVWPAPHPLRASVRQFVGKYRLHQRLAHDPVFVQPCEQMAWFKFILFASGSSSEHCSDRERQQGFRQTDPSPGS